MYSASSLPQGVDVGYSKPTVTAKDVIYPFVADVSLGFAEAVAPR